MESLSRSLHRRKLSNANNNFSGKHAYDGVFSGHRSAGAPAVNVDEYREIFSTDSSSIPVLDLSGLEESCGELDLDAECTTDYGRIFGGFRDCEIAISYEEFIARDKARAPSSTSQSSPDLGDTSHQSSDALKQFNLSYNKISQRNNDGLDGTKHVTQLPAVPGFTCFIDESASQPNKETMKQKSFSMNNVNVNSSKQDYPEKQTSTNNVDVNYIKRESPYKQTSSVEFGSRYLEASLSCDRNIKTVEADLKSHPSKVSSSPESKKETKKQKLPATNSVSSSPPAASELKKEAEKQKPPATNNVPSASIAASQPKKETENQRSSVTNNVPSTSTASSQPKKETEKQKSSVTNNVLSTSTAASQAKKETEKQKPPATNNGPSSPSQASQAKKETEKQKPPATNNGPSSPPEASQPKKATEKQQLPATNNGPSSPPEASQPKKVTEKQQPPATNNIPSLAPEASQLKKDTEKRNPYATNNIPSSPPSTSQPKKETENQMSFVINNLHPKETVDFPEKQTSHTDVESQSRNGQDEAFSDIRNVKSFQADFKSYSAKVSSSHAASATNLDNQKDRQKRSTATNEAFPPPCFDEEDHVNAAAAALRKAIEKAQESIRIAKESVGRKKEGLRGFSSKSFKESLKAKVRVASVNAGEVVKEKDDKMKQRGHKNGSTVVFSDFADGEKLFGAKKVIDETHGKISERSPFELNSNKVVCNSKQVGGEKDTGLIEDNARGNSQKDDHRPNGFLELESCERKQGDTESDNLTVFLKVETKKEMSHASDENCYEKKFNVESFGLLDNCTQENLGQEHDEKVVSAERQDEDVAEGQVKEDRATESHSEEENFYDVHEVEMIKNAQTYVFNIARNDLSQKEDHLNHKAEETYENSASDYDDAEENGNVIDASNVLEYTEDAYKADQSDNNVASSRGNDNVSSSQDNDDVSSSQGNDDASSSQDIDDVSSSHQFQVIHKKTVEEETFENISSDETEHNKDECEAKSDNLENRCVADVDFGLNDVQSDSSSDTIHGMEIEVKEYKEKEEAVEKEENNLQQSHVEIPETRIEMDTETPQEPKDACREPEPSKVAHDKEERERERIKLAVERAIREARERAFAEVRQRVIADTQEKVTKASIDKTSAQSKLKAERALVERATAEARQRALEKVMKTSHSRTQVNETKQTSSTSHTNTESALRTKAKLEKHNRIMERAAKALAEKEKRDLLALREQAERNRLAEHLDAEIKRWSTGKEGNLRALLSTLQYILGADSGWHPVSLTEIITTTAVKKAYRKATLCVHPDKLQQRGASIQQKYICEKVFDLLKAAWNRFNSEER